MPVTPTSNEPKEKPANWWLQAAVWTVLMYLVMEVLYPYAKQRHLDTRKMMIGLVIWPLAGLVYGLVVSWFARKWNYKGQKNK